jgi:hypothetical protein
MRAWRLLKHVSTIFNQEEIISIAEGAKPRDVTRKSKVVDGKDSPYIALNSRFEIRPIRFAISLGPIESDLGAEVFDRLNSRRANIRWDQDPLPGLDSERTQAVIDGVARPEEIEAATPFGFP